jgi:hypothetical protein
MVLLVIMSLIQSLFHNFMNGPNIACVNLTHNIEYRETWFISITEKKKHDDYYN